MTIEISIREKRILKTLSFKFDDIETLFSQLENDTRDYILNFHTEGNSLNHSIRQGNNAIGEILEKV